MDHTPVLLEEVVAALPADTRRIVDATLGLGGHARAMLTKAKRAELLGIDQDEASLKMAQDALSADRHRLNVVLANFRDLDWAMDQIGWGEADFILFDLGISSWQLDDPARGLSFQTKGPLDMRLDRSGELTAATIVNTWDERKLAEAIFRLGEEPLSRRIARKIVESRKSRPITTTTELATIVTQAVPARLRYQKHLHPATQTFQALRLAVNDELGALQEALPRAGQRLSEGGKLAIISFHSLEDRIAKHYLRGEPTLTELTKHPATPSQKEIDQNPRARSAKLRLAQKHIQTP